MGANEIVKLERAGHEIASHSLQHCDLSSLNDDEISYDIEEQKKLFSQMSIKASGFSYPYGNYNSQTQDLLAREFSYIRTSEDGFNDFYVDLNNIHVKTVTSTTNQTDIQQWLDYAKSNKLWLVLLYHRIDETGDYSTKVEDFSKQIKAVKDSGIRVLPVRSALKELGKL
jgi:peptidoglycan/xylan/chitin deacetylase (PgdA/CDA1 family)